MLPVPIADGVLNDTLPEHTIQTARELKFFLAENAKSARAFLKFCGHPSPIASLSIEEIGHRPDSAKVAWYPRRTARRTVFYSFSFNGFRYGRTAFPFLRLPSD